MKIYSMGEGVFDEVVTDLAGKPCVVLLCDSRDELSAALTGIGFRDEVTIVRADKGIHGSVAPSGGVPE